jgi:ketosteroid isomerase-like protein
VTANGTASPLDRYYESLDAGDVDATTATFTDDAVYIRPSLDVPGTLQSLSGRDELREFFRKRGKLPFRHEVRSCAVHGPECFVEGVAWVEGDPAFTFLVHATLDGSGLIERYFALMAKASDDPPARAG